MDAKDTVIEGRQFLKIAHEGGLNAAAKAQAEITWSIAEKAGRREVVDIIRDFDSMFCQDFNEKYGVNSTVSHTPKGLLEVLERRAKLKGWGL